MSQLDVDSIGQQQVSIVATAPSNWEAGSALGKKTDVEAGT
jgi:hypothetical protein